MSEFTFNDSLLGKMKPETYEAFNFMIAQAHEFNSHKKWLMDNFESEYRNLNNLRFDIDEWFGNALHHFDTFRSHTNKRMCVEIGCGSFPDTNYLWHIKDRRVIDPLADKYRVFEEQTFGKSFFEGFKIYNQRAEERIDELVGKVDGMIFCRNMLDHTDDPLSVLENISAYAMSGCYFLLYSDIWHFSPTGEAHRCITKSVTVMDKLLKALGFRVVLYIKPHRESNFIEYGAVLIKE
jgi:hypothetical protein